MQAGLYARYSSDRQHDRSIDDQLTLCRSHVDAAGGRVAGEFVDRAISGGALSNRPGILDLLDAARAGRIDTVVTEALDRLSRDQEDVAGLYKRLTYLDVAIVTVSEGRISELHVGLKGTMNAMYLTDLADKARRGQAGRVRAGRVPGGQAYGYDVVREFGPDGEPVRGLRKVNPEQAAVILRIFERYVAGWSPRQIATELNAEGVPSPRGRGWTASTINGAAGRNNGILRNPAYIGRIVYNRVRMRRDPDTGRRVSRPNAADDLIDRDAPDLRIVPQDLWDRAQAARRSWSAKSPSERQRPKRLLSGLVKCGLCGGGFTVKDRRRMGCSARREKGTCHNPVWVDPDKLEVRVLEGVAHELVAPDLIKRFQAEYRIHRRQAGRDRARRRHALVKEAADVKAEIDRLVDVVATGSGNAAAPRSLLERLHRLEARQDEIEAELAALERDDPVVDLHPGLADTYRRRVDDLRAALTADDTARREAGRILRELIDKVTVTPGPPGEPPVIELHGHIAKLAALAGAAEMPDFRLGNLVVAGEGLEPPRRGL